jgi:hypothetical protein
MVNVRLNAIEIIRVQLFSHALELAPLAMTRRAIRDSGIRDRPSARASRIRLECAWWNERLTARLDLPRL